MNTIYIYIAALAVFHGSEFLWNRWAHKRFQWDAFLISRPYLLAQFICLTEYAITTIFFNDLKNQWYFTTWLGLTGIGFGQVLRLYTLIYARTSFTHQVRSEASEDHRLLTKGPYAIVRHPGYLGWWIWAVSTQLLLNNFISALLFLVWGWIFLRNRIRGEEFFLVRFFGDPFTKYRSMVPSGIPFLK